LHDLTAPRPDLRAQFRWETINAILYKIGGLVFIVGSILFFPAFEAYADVGAWTFFAGSLICLLVTVHDLLEERRHWRESPTRDRGQVLDHVAASSYVWGTILFTVGSVFFLSTVGWVKAGGLVLYRGQPAVRGRCLRQRVAGCSWLL
jgi:predicted membrane channel-forming protein YqfA (hemolysin III family)